MTIVISDLRRDSVSGGIETSVAVKIDGAQRRLTVRHEGNHPDLGLGTPTYDPFLLFLLIPAMARNMPIVVEGDIEAMRLAAMRTGLQSLLQSASDEWQMVGISADARISQRLPDLSKGSALGMSCGIDSLFAFQDLNGPETAPHMRVKLLLHNDIGAHPDRQSFARHTAHIQRFADEMALPLVTISADVMSLYGNRFIHSHTIRNAAAAMTLEDLFCNFHYAKGDTGGLSAKLGRGSGIGPMDPVLLPLLNTSANSYMSHCLHLGRLQKTAAVMHSDLARRYLTVCTHGFSDGRDKMNCGRCYKCARALFYADTEGMLNDYSALFDIDAFKSERTHLLLRMLRGSIGDRRSREERDALAYLLAADYPLPVWLRLFRPFVGRTTMRPNIPRITAT